MSTTTNNKFLFELGFEEAPADMIEPAAAHLRKLVEEILAESRLDYESLEVFAAPRRLAFVLGGVAGRQPDREDLVLGPPASVAFRDGTLGPAAHGFARKMGVDVGNLEVVETDKGPYVGVRRLLAGKTAQDILAAALPGIISSISWPKTMYWTESRFRFVRPIRWMAALWNEAVVPLEFEGVKAGRQTKGHRFLGQGEIVLRSAGEYLDRLRENYVLADSAERRAKILDELEATKPKELKVISDPGLLDLVCYLNEYPSILLGSFDSSFLRIPSEVLITVMRHHQKYFSLADDDGNLRPYFLTVLNTSGDAEGAIRKGHEKVLRARLEDAAFFWTTDQKTRLQDRLPELDHVLFQERLGSYRMKTERIRALCRALREDDELDRAALLCKCDLTTEMVREFTELQGVMGGLYARAEGYPEAVWQAIYEHYRPSSLEDASPSAVNGAVLSIADKLDTVVGCFAAGIVPTGSSDPFALRRHAQGLIKVLLDHKMDQYPLSMLVKLAGKNLEGSLPLPGELESMVMEFLTGRVRFIFQEQGMSYDVLNAVLALGVEGVHQTWLKAEALSRIRGEADFAALAVAFKRVKNILSNQEVALQRVCEDDLEEAAESELHGKLREVEPEVEAAQRAGDYLGALRLMAGLRGAVDRFFDDVMVLTDEARLRHNRLRLLFEISRLFLQVADISEIQETGGR